jgi:3-methylfumaryl-CoA hydratase
VTGQTRSGTVTTEPGEALAGLLGVPAPDPAGGLPLLWHWLHLLDRPAQADLGADGHPLRGGVVAPPGPGRRRMWAGGRVTQWRPLRPGVATRSSRVVATEDKAGRSGPMTLVTVAHEVVQHAVPVIEEEQHLVYRGSGGPSVPASGEPGPAPEAAATLRLDVDPTLLFRFSALTYNAHRIHYDRGYATGVEGYPGLVVHGPLQALAMAGAARPLSGRPHGPVRFDYRLVAPMYDGEGLVATADRGGDGSVVTRVGTAAGRATAEGLLTPVGRAGR